MKSRTLCSVLIGALLFIGLSLGPPACAHTPASVTTPAGKAAVAADSVVKRLAELQTTAIHAQESGGLPLNQARAIVQFCVDGTKTAKATPAGWKASLLTAWTALKHDVPQMNAPPLVTYVPLLDLLLAGGVQ